MRLKKSARLRTIQRYVARHQGFDHNCLKIHCHPEGYLIKSPKTFVQTSGCFGWDKKK